MRNIIHGLGRRGISQNHAFVDEILKTLGLSHNDSKAAIDICMQGDVFGWQLLGVTKEFEWKFSQYKLYKKCFLRYRRCML